MAVLLDGGKEGRERYWREQISACERSGKSIVGYCRDAGIAASKYHWWKGELKRRASSRAVVPRFAEVRGRHVLEVSGSSGIEVALRGDRVVRVERGFDGEMLAGVVRVLEAL